MMGHSDHIDWRASARHMRWIPALAMRHSPQTVRDDGGAGET